MTRIVLLLASLALLPSAFATPFQAISKLVAPTNFDQCAAFEGPSAELTPSSDFGIADMIGNTASRTGLIDFSVTDALLSFYDEYIMGSLLSTDFRSFTAAFGFGEMPGLQEAAIIVLESGAVD